MFVGFTVSVICDEVLGALQGGECEISLFLYSCSMSGSFTNTVYFKETGVPCTQHLRWTNILICNN
jgi:hypothetical protein